MREVKVKKDCFNCKYFRNSEEVFDGYIEHRTENGEIWLKEPKRKTLPLRCVCHPEIFNNWWENVKDIPSTDDKIEVDCLDFEMSEDFKKFHLPVLEMIEMTKDILNKNDKS